jgi:hypothetical protein
VVIFVLLVGLIVFVEYRSATAQSTLTGRLAFVWGDPTEVSGSPRLLLYLISDAGAATLLDFSTSVVPPYEEVLRMSGERVTARGVHAASLSAAGQPPFIVQDLDWIRPADMTVGPIKGPQPWVTLRCRFGDSPGVDRPINTNLLTGTSYPSLDEYWRETSFNNINVSGSVVNGWVTLPQPRSYYVYDRNGDGTVDADHARLAADCTTASDPTVNFTSFVGINMLFNQALDCCLWGGGWFLNLDGQAKVWRATWIGLPRDNYDFLFAGLAHETGHGFGLPHSSGPYGFTYDSRWDLMSSLWRYVPAIGQWDPQGTISYHKDIAGWIPVNRRFIPTLGTTRTIAIERLAVPISSASYLMAQIPILGSSTEYYTVEMRQLVGHDVGVPGNAVVIHHVVTNRSGSPAWVVDPDNNGNPNDAGAMWMPGETFSDAPHGIFVTVNSLNATSATVTISVSGTASSGRELILDFGSSGGLWFYRWGAAWAQIHPSSPEGVVTGDIDGNGRDDLIIDFGSSGVWVLLNNTSWLQLHPANPSQMAAGDLDNSGRDEIILDFPGAGTWVRYNHSTWMNLQYGMSVVRLLVGNVDGSAGEDLVIEFAGEGIWSFRHNSGWGQIHPTNAQAIGVGDIDGTGQDDVIIAFQGGGGTWGHFNNMSWSLLHGTSVTQIAAGDMDGNGRDELALSFPGSGVWLLTNASAWSLLHPTNPDDILFVDVDGTGRADLVVDFGVGSGVWTLVNSTAWVHIHATSPEIITSGDIVP